jgi:1-hydroxycarotenoid 3,4-desaturase
MVVKPGRIIVIGAGVSGLTAAMLLAARGFAVELLEKEPHVGGRIREMSAGGMRINAGPTVLTLRPVFEELLAECGVELSRLVGLTRADVLARHAWSENERLDLFADRTQSADAIGAFAGVKARKGFLEFCDHAKDIFETMNPLFMRAERPTPVGLARSAGLRGLGGILASAPFTTLWDMLGRYFSDPRLRQLFGRYATYCGSSPFRAPATLALIAHVEQEGVWLVDGGMQRFAEALGRAAQAVGVKVRTANAVTEILVRNGRASEARLASGEVVEADAIVSAVDVSALVAGQMGPNVRTAVPIAATQPRSLSAATWAFVARTKGFPLAHHTVFFSRSCVAEFADLFEESRVPSDPTVYVCAQDRSAAGATADETERLFAIVNAPADGGRSLRSSEELQACQRRMLQTLERAGLTLEILAQDYTGPAEFARLFPGSEGAIYGMAADGWQASFRRSGSRSRIPGLYLAGGSVHPGAGLPMAALSGRAAARSLMADHDSMRR